MAGERTAAGPSAPAARRPRASVRVSDSDDYEASVYARVASEALGEYELPPGSSAALVNLSENATYVVTDAELRVLGYLRVHRTGYHDEQAILSELDWTADLAAQRVVRTAGVIATRSGGRVATVDVDGTSRHAVFFEPVAGEEPSGDTLDEALFRRLGEITARLHRHASDWHPPESFQRFSWDENTCIGARARWGTFMTSPWVRLSDRVELQTAARMVMSKLTEYGKDRRVFGLVHADLRPANLLIEGSTTSVIDFDDCGYSWFMYDFAAAVSFNEGDPRLPTWQNAWLEGYRTVRDLTPTDESLLATFIMMRRLMVVAWMGSHAKSKEAQAYGESFALESRVLAERYVVSQGTRIF
jgi:Ser/Thr protein kinase RdoA (MazF antagonist)